MDNVAIRVDNLCKKYRVGAVLDKNRQLRDVLAGCLVSSVRRWNKRVRPHSAVDVIWALKNVSFEVGRGEVIGIIGRNGAGKSTLLKILSRITSPTEGRIELRGRVGSLLEVGTAFHPEMTGRENIYLNGGILGMSRAEIRRKFDAIVDFSGVERFIDTPVKRYSSGMYVRLAFAVAAHLEPEILLVDEVLAVGDAAFQKKCLGKMGGVAKEGRTVLLVSHNMTMVKSLCENAILLRDGVIAVRGNVNEVVNAYLSIDQKEVLEQSWTEPAAAPGNDEVRFKKVVIAPEYRDNSNRITIDTAINIIIEFWIMRPARVNISMYLKHLSGEIIFASASSRMDISPGIANFSCRIPGNLLNDGIYSITLIVVEDARHLFTLEDGATFEVHDIARNGHWFGKWPGSMRPKLAWTHAWHPVTG